MKLKELFNKVVDFCTSSIFEDEDVETSELYADLEARKQQLKAENFRQIKELFRSVYILKKAEMNFFPSESEIEQEFTEYWVHVNLNNMIDEFNNIKVL